MNQVCQLHQTESPSKRCFKCGHVFPIGDFYSHPMMADGHLGKCKTCTKKDVKVRYVDKHEVIREYDKGRNQRPERKASKLTTQQKFRKNHPDKYRSRQAVENAIRDGRLVRLSCEVCGDAKSEAHHEDYSKPLDVKWLCLKHHRQAHGAWVSGK